MIAAGRPMVDMAVLGDMAEVMVDPEAAMEVEATGEVATEATATRTGRAATRIAATAATEPPRRVTTRPVDTALAATEEDRFSFVKYYPSQNYFNRNAFSLFYFCDVIHNKMFENFLSLFYLS